MADTKLFLRRTRAIRAFANTPLETGFGTLQLTSKISVFKKPGLKNRTKVMELCFFINDCSNYYRLEETYFHRPVRSTLRFLAENNGYHPRCCKKHFSILSLIKDIAECIKDFLSPDSSANTWISRKQYMVTVTTQALTIMINDTSKLTLHQRAPIEIVLNHTYGSLSDPRHYTEDVNVAWIRKLKRILRTCNKMIDLIQSEKQTLIVFN